MNFHSLSVVFGLMHALAILCSLLVGKNFDSLEMFFEFFIHIWTARGINL